MADTPVFGRACDDIRPGLLRAEQAGHVVFFRRELTGILVSCTSACCQVLNPSTTGTSSAPATVSASRHLPLRTSKAKGRVPVDAYPLARRNRVSAAVSYSSTSS
jgi:hypothetical protein